MYFRSTRFHYNSLYLCLIHSHSLRNNIYGVRLAIIFMGFVECTLHPTPQWLAINTQQIRWTTNMDSRHEIVQINISEPYKHCDVIICWNRFTHGIFVYWLNTLSNFWFYFLIPFLWLDFFVWISLFGFLISFLNMHS